MGKEIKKESKEGNSFKFQPVEYGMQDFSAILKACEMAGIEYIVVEQDASPDRPQMESAKISRDY